MSVDIHRVGFYPPEVPQTHMAAQQGIYASAPPMNSNISSQSNVYLQQFYPSPGLCTPPSTSSNSNSSNANSLSPTLSGYYSPSDYAASMRPYDYAPGANIGELSSKFTYGSMY
ncbi:uncharacterized protein FOMMEDRAFT_141421 [Fomitiporia mediterranea MF3/22]|uniref:uncharacterized protein n=1 Tax=Fomitiporia mediterranea (strain MF3/22) TaxID=694068 RepID=UPI00044097C5|nr:uncharacterized protein FOMMEDRAFT_141421 [Fomitiporia mediterranea MF3/22]EJD02348.1 hypothetical protein FOMMEDRAFT_141421 [Fomitiporia mediterranea MF3/22]